MFETRHILKAKLRALRAQVQYLPRTLRLVWEASPGWTSAWAGLLVLQGVLPVAVVYLTRPLVESVLTAASSPGDWTHTRDVLRLAAAMAAVLMLIEVLRSVTVWIRTAQSELLHGHITSLIHQKSVEADLAFYETAEYHDTLHRARADASHRCVALLDGLGSLFQNGITLVAMAGILVSFGLWLTAALVASTLPALYVVISSNLRLYHWRQRHTADERRAWYYDWVLTSTDAAAEIRLFDLGDHFSKLHHRLRSRLGTERITLAKRQSLADITAGALAMVITAAAIGAVALKAVRGVITLGELALFYQAFQQGLRLARTSLDNIGQLYANSLFLGDLFAFLALEPRVTESLSPIPVQRRSGHEIRFIDVLFRYPGSSRVALDRFNLHILPGQTAAIVGPNGAGKSTLLRLLCRFYDPDAGRIEIDGIDLRRIPLQQLRGLITVLFQQPVHYNDTVRENISLGDRMSALDDARIRAASEAAGAEEFVHRMPHLYESLLGRSFVDGTELSGGEWQRVGLARAFVRQAPIIILDEPTSAMDPWAETDWLDRFQTLSSGRTALVITHRLTTAMRADVIHVVADGRTAESGNHEQLLARRGLYAQAWAQQTWCQPA